MNILHLTDLHFARKGRGAQDRVIKSIISRLEGQAVDLVFFTGDLVNTGESIDDFIGAQEMFLDPLLNAVQVERGNLFLCPGNHDINRKVERASVTKYMDDNLTSNDLLNNFVKGQSEDYKDSFRPLENYNKFLTGYFKESVDVHSDQIDPFYTIHKRTINGEKVGVVTINTAWRAVGKTDRGNLLFPIVKIHEAIAAVKDCGKKILLHHHPFAYLKEFNEYDLEDIVYNSFDIAFSGHLHKSSSNVTITANDGIIKIGGPASLAPDRAEVGFSILQFDYDSMEFHTTTDLYDKRNEVFYSLPKRTFEIPTNEARRKQNSFRKVLRKKYDLELNKANDLFIATIGLDEQKNFLELFTMPVLRSKSSNEMLQNPDVDPEIDFDTLLSSTDDIIIMGRDKCGKTSLLKKIQLELLKNYSKLEIVPYYIDAREVESVNLIKEFQRYFEINQKDAGALITQQKVILLVDNLNKHREAFTSFLSFVIGKNISLRIALDETTYKSMDDYKIEGRTFTKLYFHKLRKKHIRMLANNWSELHAEKREEIVEKIETMFSRLSIPYNFWTVSLFLWIFKKGAVTSFQNDVGLVDLYIESLLEREKLIRSKAGFGFDKYKKFLAHFAHYLLTNHHDNLYSAAYLETIQFTENHLALNPRNEISAREVWDYIEQRGIVKKTDQGRYTFRLRGVFEYFLAYYMKLDPAFRNKVLSDDSLYLSFANEFELYAGFSRDDGEFLDAIFSKTKRIFQSVHQEYKTGTSIDNHLKSKIIQAQQLRDSLEKISKELTALSFDQQDALEVEMGKEISLREETEVSVKAARDLDEKSIETLETALKILGRVFKNVDEIDEERKVYEVFDYVLESSCFWGFELIESTKDELKDHPLLSTDNQYKTLLQILANFIPTIVQTNLYDIIGHRSIQKLVKARIEQLSKDASSHQYQLFLLLFLLADISLTENKRYIEDAIKLIKIPTLKFSILVKLHYYFAFKTNVSKELESYLRDKIQEQQLNFNKETDLGLFHQNIEELARKKIEMKKLDE